MSDDVALQAAARQRLLALSAALLEALYDAGAVQVLSTLKPADMRPGGARVPGTSYELESTTAARAISALLALRGIHVNDLAYALAEADFVARYAMLAGQPPPVLATLYAQCTPDVVVPGSESLDAALQALQGAAEKIFTPGQVRRITTLVAQWREQPARLDAMPVQQFVATFVRNAPVNSVAPASTDE